MSTSANGWAGCKLLTNKTNMKIYDYAHIDTTVTRKQVALSTLDAVITGLTALLVFVAGSILLYLI